MKTLAFVLLIASLQTDPLVEASKEAKEKRKKSTSKVITNKDVKKSKGKIVERSTALPQLQQTAAPVTQAEHDATRKAAAQAQTRINDVEARIAVLEKELAKIEQAYFEENDPNVRDNAIAKRFNETKAKLDAARAELDGLHPSPGPRPPSPQ